MDDTNRNLLICPITKQIFKDPVMADDGFIYEKEAIVKWLESKVESPMTKVRITNRIIPALAVRSYVETFLESHPEEKCNQYEITLQDDMQVMTGIRVTSADNASNETNYLACNQIENNATSDTNTVVNDRISKWKFFLISTLISTAVFLGLLKVLLFHETTRSEAVATCMFIAAISALISLILMDCAYKHEIVEIDHQREIIREQRRQYMNSRGPDCFIIGP